MKIEKLKCEQITSSFLQEFVRRQEVKLCWRKSGDTWVLKEDPFIDDWDGKAKERLSLQLKDIAAQGGCVLAAWDEATNALAGFAAVKREFFGKTTKYVPLLETHTSLPYRGQGVGKRLFREACKFAKGIGAEKLYISAHSADETQRFYRGLGCVDALEVNEALYNLEPFDCHLEYVL